MSSEQISELFAEPFDLFDINPSDVSTEKTSIIFVGGRGTGKTMLLRQFSYNVQRVSLPERTTFLEKVKNYKYVGIYFRVDNPLLRSLEIISSYSNDAILPESVFTHYFELTIFKEYLEIVKLFLADLKIEKENKSYSEIIIEIKKLIPCPDISNAKRTVDINDLISFIVNQINYIWKYQSEKAIDIENTIKFEPTCGMMLQGRLTNEFLHTSIMELIGLPDVNFLLLIDEFENFSEIQQRVLNTAMRFAKTYGARFRIGMRPNGFKTYGTLDDTDYIKEGRDYRKVEFDFPFIKKDNKSTYPNLVKIIADKRLALTPEYCGKSIADFLGESEDLETEAKEIVKGRDKHIEVFINLINSYLRKNYAKDDILPLRHENPLFEMENLRLLLSGKNFEYVTKAFNDYKNDVESEERKKYSNDYDKKYKLTFIFILCSIYRIEKKEYYSFTDYCQLSSGIVGCFIELCRRAFDIAYFKEREALFSGTISKKIQTDAAYEYAQSEREMIQRISLYGGKLRTFIDNIGNVFGIIHKDLYMRYPETNLFPVVLENLSDQNKKLLEVACTWSLLVKKPNTQDAKGNNQKQDIYYINRVLAPVFKISYRTRGGLNPVSVTNDFFETDFDPKSILPNKIKKISEHQKTLFDAEPVSDNVVNIDLEEEEE
jgi:hypothetical protein